MRACYLVRCLHGSQLQLQLQQAAFHVDEIVAGERAGPSSHQRVRLPRGPHCDINHVCSLIITADNMQTSERRQANVSEGLLRNDRLTVVHGDARVSVRCQNVAAVTATQEAADCVHTLMVTHVATWLLTLIDVCVCDRERKIKRHKQTNL